MQEYRKKATVKAKIFEQGDEDGMSCQLFRYDCLFEHGGKYKQCHECNLDLKKAPYVSTLENDKHFAKDFGLHYVVIGIKGERWLVEKSIFKETYEPI